MVFEDALTVLSYASPYPVKLKLQKEAPVSPTETSPNKSEVEAKGDLHHPLYKSQSMDDIRHITQEGMLGPRRTFSEMKRNGPLPKSVEEGHLKKWKNKQELVNEESLGFEAAYPYSSFHDGSIPDMKLDMVDSKDGDDGTEDSSKTGPPAVVEIHIPDANFEKSVSLNEIPAIKIDEITQRKAASDINLSTDSGECKVEIETPVKPTMTGEESTNRNMSAEVGGEADVTIPDLPTVQSGDVNIDLEDVYASSRDAVETVEDKVETIVVEEVKNKSEDVERCTTETVSVPKIEVDVPSITIESETDPIAPRRKRTSGSNSSEKSDAETDDKKIKLDENKNTEVEVDVEMLKEKIALIENDIEDNPGQIDFMDVDLNGDFQQTPHINVSTHPADVKVQNKQDDGEESEEVVEIEEDQMRAVLRDYFGDQPTLLQQFGMSGPPNGEEQGDDTKEVSAPESRNIKDVESPDSGVVEEKKSSLSDSPTSSRSSSVERENKTNKKSNSPNIRRKSGGGLAFDITTTEFKGLPDEIPQEARGDPKGGIAYYVRFDQQHNPTPSQQKDDSSQPPLVKAPGWDRDDANTTSYQLETSETNHVDDNSVKVQKVDTVQLIGSGGGDDTTVESKSSKINVRLSSDNSEKSETPTLIAIGEELNDSEA